jgi:hypothetical protein
MNKVLHVNLDLPSEESHRLTALQSAVADVCNALTPIVQQSRCWNRVGLHHLAYRDMRERFPHVGSQMICNAIYAVSRTCKLLFQNPLSPFSLNLNQDKPLPLLRFLPNSPVYFDRHTLSIKSRQLSMYTLNGRIKFEVALTNDDAALFTRQRLREIVLNRFGDNFRLSFYFSPNEQPQISHTAAPTDTFPDYVNVISPETILNA